MRNRKSPAGPSSAFERGPPPEGDNGGRQGYDSPETGSLSPAIHFTPFRLNDQQSRSLAALGAQKNCTKMGYAVLNTDMAICAKPSRVEEGGGEHRLKNAGFAVLAAALLVLIGLLGASGFANAAGEDGRFRCAYNGQLIIILPDGTEIPVPAPIPHPRCGFRRV